MKTIKRTLAVLLTLLMLISAVPLGVMNAGAATTYLWPVVNGTANSHVYKCTCNTHKGKHYGQDIGGAPYGQAILSPTDGKITKVYSGCRGQSNLSKGQSCSSKTCTPNNGFYPFKDYNGLSFCNGGFGNGVIVQNTSTGYSFSVAHLAYDPLVKQGQTVKKGDVLGYVGETGCSAGVHLHLSVTNKSGTTVNPMSLSYSKPKTTASSSGLAISGVRYPKTKRSGEAFIVSGLVSSNAKISSVSISVVNSSGSSTSFGSASPNTYYYDLNSLDSQAKFASLKTSGTYTYKIIAKDSNNNTLTFSKSFTVGSGATTYGFDSAVSSKVATPTISSSNDDDGQKVTISCATSGATIYYTLDGKNPTTSSTKYTDPIPLTSTKTVKAIAVKSGMTNSAIASKIITVTPVATPTISFAVTNAGFKTTITTATAGAKIYYTTDGTTPTTASLPYNANEGFTMGTEGTVKAKAVKSGMANSEVASASTPSVEVPAAPSIERDASTPATIGIGDTISLKWNATQYTYQYVLTVEKDGEPVAFRAQEPVNVIETQGTTTSFATDAAGIYTITAKAENFLGESADQTSVSVTVKPDVTVTFKNYDGKSLRQDVIHWGGTATLPTPPERKGYTFKAWSGTYTNVKADSEVVATYTPKTYAVEFVDENGNQLSKIIADYDSSVTPPAAPVKTGYTFVGWSVKSGEGDSYEKINGAVTFEPIYVWSNPDMPLGVSIDSALRSADAKSYEVHAKVTNNTSDVLNAKMISVIKTKNDKVVATEIDAITVPANASEKAYNTTISGTNDAMECEVYIVANDPDNANRTGGAYSEKATKEVTREASNTYTYWSDWSDWSTTPVTESDTVEVESVKKYRYQDKITTTSSSSSLAGWTPSGSSTSYGNWSGWSAWTKGSAPTPTDVKNVQTATVYNYYYFKCPNCGKHSHVSNECYTWADNGCGKKYPNLMQEYERIWSNVPTSSGTSNVWGTGRIKVKINGATWFYRPEGGYGAGYRTQTRTKTVTYSYWKWGELSDWSETPVSSTDSRQVFEETFYRYRTLETATTVNTSAYDVVEDLSGTSYSVRGTLKNVNADYSGKTAIVMVYKDRNTDPTENQIEYVGAITLDPNNAYDFSFIPREEISVATGNYIVSFGIATASGLVNNVEMIEAPKPEYKVDFQDVEGNIISSQNVTAGEDAVLPEVPDVEGNNIRWNRTNTNINSDTIIKAEPLPKTYTVVFVDWANNCIVDTQEALYGSEIQFPADCSATGKTFVGWSVPAGSTVTGTMIIESVYEDIMFNVTFLNQNGTVYDTQRVAYGSSVILPEENPTADGYEFLAWSNNAKWWNVTENLTVEPVFVFAQTAPTPIFVPHEDNDIIIEEDLIIFDAPEDGSKIYVTTDGSDPTEDDILLEENIFVANRSMRLKARAFKENMNPSDIVEIDIDVLPESSVPVVVASTNPDDGYAIENDSAKLVMRVQNPYEFVVQSYGFFLYNADTEDTFSYEKNDLNGLHDKAFGRRFPIPNLEAGTYTYTFYVDIDGLGTLESETETFTIGNPAPHVHTYDAGVITTQPTCTEPGVKTYTCTTCDANTEGHTKTETINKLDHTEPDSNGKCTRCGEQITPPPVPQNICKWCGKVHEGFFQKIIGFFHNILAAILGAKY